MNITPFNNSFKLCEHWLSNAKNNILNKEILNLQIFSCGDIEHSFEIVKIFIQNIMNESEEEILEDSKNCFATRLYTLYFDSVNLMDISYEQNRNIIFATTSIPDFTNFNRSILCVSLKGYSLDLNSKFRNNLLNKDFLDNFLNNINNSNEFKKKNFFLSSVFNFSISFSLYTICKISFTFRICPACSITKSKCSLL